MTIKLMDVEPYAIPPVEDNIAQMFLRHLTGNETFEYYGNQKPKCWLIKDLNYKYPRLTSAHGLLLSIDVNSFIQYCQANPTAPFQSVLNKYYLCDLHIDLGGSLTSPKVYV